MKSSLKRVIAFSSVVGVFLLYSCGSENSSKDANKKDKKEEFIDSVKSAHKANKFNQMEGLKFHIHLESIQGITKLSGTFFMRPSMSQIKFKDDSSNTTLIFNKGQTWIKPDTSKFSKPRFHIMTWPYFLTFPYKLEDPGTQLTVQSPDTLNGTPYPTALLTFKAGTGASPDDWYRIHRSPETGLIHSLAYIVTYQRSKEKAEKDPHAILYKDHENFNGIPIPRRWVFRKWDQRTGFGKKYQKATISNLKSVSLSNKDFKPGENAKKISQ